MFLNHPFNKPAVATQYGRVNSYVHNAPAAGLLPRPFRKNFKILERFLLKALEHSLAIFTSVFMLIVRLRLSVTTLRTNWYLISMCLVLCMLLFLSLQTLCADVYIDVPIILESLLVNPDS